MKIYPDEVTTITVLKLLHNAYKNGSPSMDEIGVHLGKSKGTVYMILQNLVERELVLGPRYTKAARDYRISEKGENYLFENGYIKDKLVFS